MKRWAILTVCLYALALIMLTVPVLLAVFGGWWGSRSVTITIKEALSFYTIWAYWLWLALLVAGQSLLLLLPINIAEHRLPARRPLEVPVIVTAFFLANLLFAGIVSVLCAIGGDDALGWFDPIRPFLSADYVNASGSGDPTFYTIVLTVLVFWLAWAAIFRRAGRTDEPDALVKRATRWLLRGSILELIIAVPSHVIVRRRDNCCAPAGTFWGIATGISVMLLCFGPGVYFLFVERMQKLRPKSLDKTIAQQKS